MQIQKWLNQLLPFLLVGIVAVTITFGIVLLAYLLFFGLMVGIILFTISWVRQKFFPPKTIIKKTQSSGRVIDTDEWKEL